MSCRKKVDTFTRDTSDIWAVLYEFQGNRCKFRLQKIAHQIELFILIQNIISIKF